MKNVLLNNPKIYATSGLPNTFIRQAIVGGRCMVRNNDAYFTKALLVDFDAVSLYPSAISIMKVPLGTPKHFENVIPDDADYYVVEIVLKKVGKHYSFPLIRFEEDGENIWTDDDRCLNRRYIVDKRVPACRI